MYIIVTYDITKNNNYNKRYRKIYSICKQYLTHVQNSVFEGDITNAQLKEFSIEISRYIDKDIDSFTIFKHSSKKWLDKTHLGKNDFEKISTIF